MKIERFGELKTGRVVPISIDSRRSDWAFIPNPLPPTWRPNAELWALIAEARDRVGQLDGTGRVLPNAALLLRPLQKREAITSNTIEGTFVTPRELLLFQAGGDDAHAGVSEQKRDDWLEVVCYEDSLEEGCARITSGAPIDRTLICALHRKLLLGARGRTKQPGEFRDIQVFVEAAARYIPPPPEDLEACISNIEAFLADPGAFDPLVSAFVAHYQFEAIHPFRDGNGRLGRLLLSLTIFKWLRHAHAWLYMSEFFEKHRREYIERLFAVSAEGDWDAWIRFCLIGAIEQADAAVQRCRKLDELKSEYVRRVGHLGKRMNVIITRLFANPFVEVARLARELGVSYPSARKDVRRLVEAGVLSEMEKSHPQAFCASEIFDLAYMT